MIENQEELRTALEKNREQKVQIKQLEAAQTSRQDAPSSEMSAEQEQLQTHVSFFINSVFLSQCFLMNPKIPWPFMQMMY